MKYAILCAALGLAGCATQTIAIKEPETITPSEIARALSGKDRWVQELVTTDYTSKQKAPVVVTWQSAIDQAIGYASYDHRGNCLQVPRETHAKERTLRYSVLHEAAHGLEGVMYDKTVDTSMESVLANIGADPSPLELELRARISAPPIEEHLAYMQKRAQDPEYIESYSQTPVIGEDDKPVEGPEAQDSEITNLAIHQRYSLVSSSDCIRDQINHHPLH